MAYLFSPCSPCCNNCKLIINISDLCGNVPPGWAITITDNSSGKIVKQYQSKTLTENNYTFQATTYGSYIVAVSANGYQAQNYTLNTCPPTNCYFPRTLYYTGSVTQAMKSANYFNNLPVNKPESVYTLTYGSRPSVIPKTLTTVVYDPTKNSSKQDTYNTLNMPDQAWFSSPILATLDDIPITVYFYLYFLQSQAYVMVINTTKQEQFGAASSILVNTNVQCFANCYCQLVPKTINLQAKNPLLFYFSGIIPKSITMNLVDSVLKYQNIPSDTYTDNNIVPSQGWFSDITSLSVPGANDYLGTDNLIFRYLFCCVSQTYNVYLVATTGSSSLQTKLIPIANNRLTNLSELYGPLTKISIISTTSYIDGSNESFSNNFIGNTCNPWYQPLYGLISVLETVQRKGIILTLSGNIDPPDNAVVQYSFKMIPNLSFVTTTNTPNNTYIYGSSMTNDIKPDSGGSAGIF